MQWFQNIITTHRQSTNIQAKSQYLPIFHWHLWNVRPLLSRKCEFIIKRYVRNCCMSCRNHYYKYKVSLNFVIHPLMLIFIASWLVEWPLEIREVDVKYSFVTISSSRTADILDVSRALSFGLFSIFWEETGQVWTQVSVNPCLRIRPDITAPITAAPRVWPEPEPLYYDSNPL